MNAGILSLIIVVTDPPTPEHFFCPLWRGAGAGIRQSVYMLGGDIDMGLFFLSVKGDII